MLVGGVLGADVAFRHPGVIDQDVAAAVLALDPGRRLVDLAGLGDVERQRVGFDVERLEPGPRLLATIGQQLADDHPCARLAQRLGTGEADALARAGDHRGPPLEIVLLQVHSTFPHPQAAACAVGSLMSASGCRLARRTALPSRLNRWQTRPSITTPIRSWTLVAFSPSAWATSITPSASWV